MLMAWVPTECTLPTAEQPLRVAEFDDLFVTALRKLSRPAPQRLRLLLDRAAEQRTRELVARETACCSLFTFTLSAGEDMLCLDIEVPASRTPVLDDLADRAARSAPLSDTGSDLPQ
jgi:hypothetical protein